MPAFPDASTFQVLPRAGKSWRACSASTARRRQTVRGRPAPDVLARTVARAQDMGHAFMSAPGGVRRL